MLHVTARLDPLSSTRRPNQTSPCGLQRRGQIIMLQYQHQQKYNNLQSANTWHTLVLLLPGSLTVKISAMLITHQLYYCTCGCESAFFLSFRSVGDCLNFSCVRATFPSVPPLQMSRSLISQNHHRSFC